MSDDDLKAIEARLGAATPGEWRADHLAPGDIVVDDPREPDQQWYIGFMDTGGPRSEANLDFVINAGRDIRALLAELRRVRALNDAMVNDRLLDSDAAQMAVRRERERITGVLEEEIAKHRNSRGDQLGVLQSAARIVNSDRKPAPSPAPQKASA